MSDPAQSPEARLDSLIADYLKRVEAGETIAPEDFVATAPDLRQPFLEFIETSDSLDQLAEKVPAQRPNVSAVDTSRSGTLDETIAPTKQSTEKIDDSGIPKTFGRYEIKKLLGEGAMGAVYQAFDTQLHRLIALKVPKISDDDPDLLARFYREARTAGAIRNANICPVYDVGDIDGQHYISMAYIEGKPLSAFIRPDKPIPVKSMAVIMRKLSIALQEAHALGVIHRDLKPDNIMIDKKHEPVIMDFGLARVDSPLTSARMTQSGMILGTPAYMSPEQVEASLDNIGAASDQYAMGVILYKMCAGQLPFRGSAAAVFGQIMTKEPEAPSEIRAGVPPKLEAICLKMMSKNIEDRYADMQEVAEVLAEFLKNPGPKKKVVKQEAKPADSDAALPDKAAAQAADEALVKTVVPEIPFDPSIETLRPGTAEAKSAEKPTTRPKQKAASEGPPWWTNRLVQLGGLGGLVLLLGIVFFVRLGKYDVKITLDDPSISLSVDGKPLNDVLVIRDGISNIRLSAGEHELVLEKDGLKTHVEEFTVTKDGKTALTVTIVNDKLDALRNGEKAPTTSVASNAPMTEPPASSETHAGPTPIIESGGHVLSMSTDSYVSVPTLLLPTTGELTLEMVVHPTDHYSYRAALMGDPDSGSLNLDNGAAMGYFFHEDLLGDFPLELNQTYHVALVRSVPRGTKLFVDGKLVAHYKDQTGLPETSPQPGSFRIGRSTHSSRSFVGQMNEVRVSTVARYQDDFTPPGRHKADAQTLALYHFDEGTGDVLKDSSGNGHDGKIVGAKWVEQEAGQVFANDPEQDFPGGLEFDGGDVVHVDSLEFDPTQPFTLEAAFSWQYKSDITNEAVFAGRDGDTHSSDAGTRFVSYSFGHFSYRLGDVSINEGRIPEKKERVHLALVHTGEELLGFRDGKLMGRTPTTGKDLGPGTGRFLIGKNTVGRYEMLRFSTTARYDKDYDPQTRFTPDEDTLALYHFDEGTGDVLKDSSGNGHDGKIVGANWVSSSVSISELLTSPDYEWTEPVLIPFPDGLQPHTAFAVSGYGPWQNVYFNAWNEATKSADLFVADRSLDGNVWGVPKSLPKPLNGTSYEGGSTVTTDGLVMVFVSDRSGGQGGQDLWIAERKSTQDPFGPPVNVGKDVNTDGAEADPALSGDGLTLVWKSRKTAEQGGKVDFRIASRKTRKDRFENSKWLSLPGEPQGDKTTPWLSPDGNTLLFVRKGGKPYQFCVSTRNPDTDSFGPAIRFGQDLAGFADGVSPRLSPDGKWFYFSSRQGPEGQPLRLWMCQRVRKGSSAKEGGGERVDTAPAVSNPGPKLSHGSTPGEQHGSAVGPSVSISELLTSTDYEWTEPVRVPFPDDQQSRNSSGVSGYGTWQNVYFSGRNSGNINDIFVVERSLDGKTWGTPQALPEPINGTTFEGGCSVTADGLVIVFDSARPGAVGKRDLWIAERKSTQDPFGQPMNLGEPVNTARDDNEPAISGDGLTLVWGSPFNPFGQKTQYALRIASRKNREDSFGNVQWINFGKEQKTQGGAPWLSPDGNTLLFVERERGFQFCVSTRNSPTDPFGPFVRFGDDLPGFSRRLHPRLSPDRKWFYFGSNQAAKSDNLWMCQRVRKDSAVTGVPGESVATKPVVSTGGAKPVIDSSSDLFGLECTEDSSVEVPSLKLNRNRPMTIEAYFTPSGFWGREHLVAGVEGGFGITVKSRDHAVVRWNAEVNSYADIKVLQQGLRYHLAAVYTGTKVHAFLNGKHVKTFNGPSFVKSEAIFKMGDHLPGRLGPVRVSSIVRYKTDFTPTQQMQTDKDTLALYKFDEGTGDVPKDSSGNGHHGRIVGAKWVGLTAKANVAPVSDRQAIELMLSRKASAVVLKDGQRILINESSQIPDQPFEIRGIIQTGGVARPGSITDADCQVFAQIETIDELSLSGAEVTAVGLRAFASSENIVSVEIPRTAQDPAATKKTGAVVNAFPNLRCVSFPYFCGEEFAAEIQGKTSIIAVSLYRSHQTQQGIAHLATLPNLKFLNAFDTSFRKAELQQLSEFPQLQHLAISLHKDMPLPDLDSLANISTLKTIAVFTGDQRQAECDAYVRKLLPNCQPLNTDGMRVELIDFDPKPLDALN